MNFRCLVFMLGGAEWGGTSVALGNNYLKSLLLFMAVIIGDTCERFSRCSNLALSSNTKLSVTPESIAKRQSSQIRIGTSDCFKRNLIEAAQDTRLETITWLFVRIFNQQRHEL